MYPGTPSAPGTPIDASGQLADGTRIDGVAGLREALMRKPDIFVRTMAEKLTIYALGRGLEAYDMPEVRRIVRAASANDYRFSSLVMGIVDSPAFTMRVKGVVEPVEPAPAAVAARR
jgi:hypothetical protein